MGKDSKIEWTDHTFNPWIGCTMWSPGCANCYAAAQDAFRFSKTLGGATKENPISHWGKGAPRHRTSEPYWKSPLKWDKESRGEGKETENCPSCESPWKDCQCGYAQRNPRVFCASMADWLDDEIPIEWLADLLVLIHQTQHLDWLLLTKRPENWRDRITAAHNELFKRRQPTILPACYMTNAWLDQGVGGPRPPQNVWFGVSMENQEVANYRHEILMQIPAKIRFWSGEPLLSHIDAWPLWNKFGKPDWVICGGESGDNARPMNPEWARSLRHQCASEEVAFLFKQWGEWLPDCQRGFRTKSSDEFSWGLIHEDGGFRLIMNEGERDWQQSPEWKKGEQGTMRVGKVKAGRFLDGVEWNQYPEVSHG